MVSSASAVDGTALSLRGITKRFGALTAVDGIDLDIAGGEFFTIVGPSGSGKSTLVRLLAGLEKPDAGKLLLRGEDITRVPANRRPTAMVFQSLALFDHKSVGENIEFALKMRKVDPAARRDRALELLALVRLPDDYYSRAVTQCSGGERQRVAMARALASDPEILFFDEPLSALDYRLRKTLEVELKDLHQRTGKTFVYITHSLEEAMVMSDRIAIMQTGRFVQTGSPEDIYRRPVNRFVAGFMGEVNILRVTESGGGREFAELGLPVMCYGLRVDFRGQLFPGSAALLALADEMRDTALIAEFAAGSDRDALEVGERAQFGFARADIAWVDE